MEDCWARRRDIRSSREKGKGKESEKKGTATLIGDEESEDEEGDQIPFTSDEESDDSRVHVILYSYGEKSDVGGYEGEMMIIKRDADGQPVQKATLTNSDKPSESSLLAPME